MTFYSSYLNFLCCFNSSNTVGGNQSGHLGSLVWKAWVLPAPHTHSGQRRDISKGRTKCAFIELRHFVFITKFKINFLDEEPVCYCILLFIGWKIVVRGCTFQKLKYAQEYICQIWSLWRFSNIYFVVTDTSIRICTLACSVPDPHSDAYVFGLLHGSASGSVILTTRKKWRKTLVSTVLWLLCDFLSWRMV